MKSKKSLYKKTALMQIFVMVIGIIAFSELISAQISSTPLIVNIGNKVVQLSEEEINEIDESSQEDNGIKIQPTGNDVADAASTGGGKSVKGIFGNIGYGIGGFIKPLFGTDGINSLDLKAITIQSGFFWSLVIAVITYGITWLATGGDAEESLYWATTVGGTLASYFATQSLTAGILEGLGATTVAGPVGIVVGLVVAAITFVALSRRKDARAVALTCNPWQAKTGGKDCEKCNDKEFPCTLYQCKSLGQDCELVNEGPNARCIYKNPNDASVPKIKVRNDSLQEGYKYANINSKGAKINYTTGKNGCVPAYQRLSFGIELDKTGICKVDMKSTTSFSEMSLPFGQGIFAKNHTHWLIFPGQEEINETEETEIPSGGDYKFYVRCEGTNGNSNIEEFVFEICVDPLPDTTQPNIYGFNFQNNTPIKWFDEDEEHETSVKVYTNELSSCKWSHSDKEYELMEYSLSCPNSQSNFNAQLSYTCSGKLTGIENSKSNTFYFRCNDSKGNVNTASKSLTLIGSNPLVIDSVSPNNETIKGASNLVKVTLSTKTSAGYNQGNAYCYYSSTGEESDYLQFEKTNSYTHSHDLYLEEEEYNFHIRCFDAAGNYKEEEIEFEVETDTQVPFITRIYNEENQLKIITNEKSDCVYDVVDCSYDFEEGIIMTTTDNLNHYADWDTTNQFFIKCKDEYENKPNPDKCSIIANTFNAY